MRLSIILMIYNQCEKQLSSAYYANNQAATCNRKRSIGRTELSEERRTHKKLQRIETPNAPMPKCVRLSQLTNQKRHRPPKAPAKPTTTPQLISSSSLPLLNLRSQTSIQNGNPPIPEEYSYQTPVFTHKKSTSRLPSQILIQELSSFHHPNSDMKIKLPSVTKPPETTVLRPVASKVIQEQPEFQDIGQYSSLKHKQQKNKQYVTSPTTKSANLDQPKQTEISSSTKRQNNHMGMGRSIRDSKEQMVSSSGSRYELKLFSEISSDRASVSINSKISSVRNKNRKSTSDRNVAQEVVEKVEIHLEIINCFAQNACWIDDYYQNDSDWDLVRFYTYNRYYIQRQKIYNSLSKASESCFVIRDIQISKQQLKQVYKSPEVKQICRLVSQQNDKIRAVLQTYFNILQPKPYPRVTLDRLNSQQLIEQSDIEIQGLYAIMLQKRLSIPEKNIYKKRIVDLMKMVFLIQELDGVFVKNFTDSINVIDLDRYIAQNTWLYDNILQNRC